MSSLRKKLKAVLGYDPIINEHIAQLKEEEAKRVKIIKKMQVVHPFKVL